MKESVRTCGRASCGALEADRQHYQSCPSLHTFAIRVLPHFAIADEPDAHSPTTRFGRDARATLEASLTDLAPQAFNKMRHGSISAALALCDVGARELRHRHAAGHIALTIAPRGPVSNRSAAQQCHRALVPLMEIGRCGFQEIKRTESERGGERASERASE